MKRSIRILALLCVTTAGVSGGTGSNYTIFGVGDLRLSGSVRNNGIGYAGLALGDGQNINVNSPGTWSAITDTRIEASLLYEGFRSTDANTSLSVSSTNFSGGSLAVPVSTRFGIVAVASMLPYSNRNYNVFTRGSQEGFDYVLNHKGNGGLGKGEVGLSYAPFAGLSVGASFDYVFGSLENSRTLQPTSLEYAGGETVGRTRTKGVTGTFGLLVSGFGGDLIPELAPLSLGFVFTTRGYLSASTDFLFTTESEADTTQATTNEILIPASFSIGAAYRVGNRFAVSVDFFSQQWRRTHFPVQTRDAKLYAFGMERLPSREKGASMIDRLALRLGSYIHHTYYVVNGTGITEWGMTGGIGIPLSGENRLNLAIEYGQRGSTNNGLIKESIVRFSLGIAISEIWFLTFEDE